jgi:ankyrin repeat protein
LDFLLRSHALNLVYPAPLLPGLEANPRTAALWCMSYFGKLAHFATPHVLSTEPPAEPLRSDSLLHMAVARGAAEKVRSHLEKGVPIDLRGRGGLAPLHWSVARDDAAMMTLLLAAGSPVDVRSVEGATPLMNAAQQRKIEHVAFLLREGADANAADHRGFTALHRAAEMGEQEIVLLLLDRGASRNVQAQGHTPRSLAAFRGEQAIVDLLDRQDGDC